MRKPVLATVTLAALLAGAGPALAFEQLPASQDPQVITMTPGENGLALSYETEADNKAGEKDRKFKVPGLGSLDMPKLDFGLELMYGASPQTAAPETVTPDNRGDDMMIRGTLKRRF